MKELSLIFDSVSRNDELGKFICAYIISVLIVGGYMTVDLVLKFIDGVLKFWYRVFRFLLWKLWTKIFYKRDKSLV